MSSVKIPYKKLYLIQLLFGNLTLVTLVTGVLALWAQSIFLFGVLFAVTSIVWLVKGDFVGLLTGKKVAIVVSEQGILDYSQGYRVGWIAWEEIAAIELQNLIIKKRVCLKLHQPKELLTREKRSWKRWRMRWAILFYKTPFIWENRIIAFPQKDFLRLLQEAKAGTYDFNNLGQHLIEQ